LIVDNSSGSVPGAGTVLRAGAGAFPRAGTNAGTGTPELQLSPKLAPEEL